MRAEQQVRVGVDLVEGLAAMSCELLLQGRFDEACELAAHRALLLEHLEAAATSGQARAARRAALQGATDWLPALR